MVKYSSIMPDRKWKHFPGNNRFYCDGLLISSKQVAILIFLVITIIVTSALFFAFDCRFMITEVHPACVLIAVVGVLAMFYSLMFLLKAGCIDPGFLPRARPDEAACNQALGDEDPTNTARGFLGTPARYKTVVINGQEVKLKFCVTCNVFRPPRASHCGLCNNCVENFDHHCPWVGNCVAKRNYRFFYLFLVTVCFSSLYMMSVNIAVIVVSSLRIGFVNAIKTYPASIVEFIISGFCVLAVTGLACFHTSLIANMKTTNEDMKGTFNPRTGLNNPYRRGNFFKNFATVLCGPFQPSLIDRRGYMTEEDGCLQEVSYGATSTTAEPRVPADEHRDLPPSESTSVAEQTETAMPATTQDSQLMLSTSIEQDEPQSTTATDTKQLISSSSQD